MQRFKYSLLAATGLLILVGVLTSIGPRRVMAALGYTPIRDVDNPAGQPHAELTAFTITSGITTDVNLAPVPAGKRFVIEQFSVSAGVPSGQSGFCFISTRTGGNNIQHVLPVTQSFADAVFSGSDLLLASHAVRLYADPGTTPRISFRRSSSAGSGSFQATVSGYYVNL